MIFLVEVDNDGFKVYDSGGTLIDPAKDGTLVDVRTIVQAIRDSAGIKKITDALPSGDNWVGRVKVGDGTNLVTVATSASSLSSAYGTPILLRDTGNLARFALAETDGALLVACREHSAPSGATEFTLTQPDDNLTVGPWPLYHETVSAAIGNGLDLYLQSLTAGSADDPSERGSKVEIIWRVGAVDHLISRLYLHGQTIHETLPNVHKARDGTSFVGNGSTTKLVIRRSRLSDASQEIDVIVRGYTE